MNYRNLGVSEQLALTFRIETILILNWVFYVLLGFAVVVADMYWMRTGQTVDLALSVDLLAIAAKGFMVGAGLSMTLELLG